MAKNPQVLWTFRGELSFPTLTIEELEAKNSRLGFAEQKCNYQILLSQAAFDKARDRLVDVFLPYCASLYDPSVPMAKQVFNALKPDDAKALIEQLSADDPFAGSLTTPFKKVGESTLEVVPHAVAAVKVMGQKDRRTKEPVNISQTLLVTDLDQVKPSEVVAVRDVVPFSMAREDIRFYPGCRVGTSGEFYSYYSGKFAGVSFGSGQITWMGDAPEIGGSSGPDVDALLAEDD